QHYTKLLLVSEARSAYRIFEKKIRDRAVQEIKEGFSKEVVKALAVPEDKRTPQEEELAAPLAKAVRDIKLEGQFTSAEQKEHGRLLEQIGKAVLGLPEKDASQNILYDGLMEVPTATVLGHDPPELIPQVRVLHRGELSQIREVVGPAIPAALADAEIF